jgi:hypothetical protein
MANDSFAEGHLTLAVDLLSSTTVVAVFYTLTFVLYCLSLRLSHSQLRDDQGKINRLTVCTLVFQTVLLICATLDIIIKNHEAKERYINNALPKITTLMKLDQLVSYLVIIMLTGVLVSPPPVLSYTRDC